MVHPPYNKFSGRFPKYWTRPCRSLVTISVSIPEDFTPGINPESLLSIKQELCSAVPSEAGKGILFYFLNSLTGCFSKKNPNIL